MCIWCAGPWSGAKETQTFFHKLIGYQPPRGWEYQVPNAPLMLPTAPPSAIHRKPGRHG
ncbi:lipid A-modifier LpxR family protein [Chitinophaga sp. W2I13]|uniref:lipid A-modifier LpxR family protein n=1 Tax=Chitinophaga sp. W2I13 TaxID=3373923 RepID=UPI003D2181C5